MSKVLATTSLRGLDQSAGSTEDRDFSGDITSNQQRTNHLNEVEFPSRRADLLDSVGEGLEAPTRLTFSDYLKRNPIRISLKSSESGDLVIVATRSSTAILKDGENGLFDPELQVELNYDSSVLDCAINREAKKMAVAVKDMVGIYDIESKDGQVKFIHRATCLIPGYDDAPKLEYVNFSSDSSSIRLSFAGDIEASISLKGEPRGLVALEFPVSRNGKSASAKGDSTKIASWALAV